MGGVIARKHMPASAVRDKEQIIADGRVQHRAQTVQPR